MERAFCFTLKQVSTLTHLHVLASGICEERPMCLTGNDFTTDSSTQKAPHIADKCHETTQ